MNYFRSYKDSLDEYKKENNLHENDWISNKVVILFLESDKDHKVRLDLQSIESSP